MTSTESIVVQIALEKGLLKRDRLEAAQAKLAEPTDFSVTQPSLLDVLYEMQAIEPEVVAKLLADEFGMPLVDLASLHVPSEVLDLIPREVAAKHHLMPYAHEGGKVRVAISDPLETDGVDNVAYLLKMEAIPSVTTAADIRKAIDRFYGKDAAALDKLIGDFKLKPSDDGTANENAHALDSDVGDADAPIIKLVHQVIFEAIQRRASDIHLEPLEKRFRVRYRIDGVLLEVDNPPKRLQLSIVSRLKIMANISIAEKRIPQDGRIQVTVAGRALDLRVSTLPTAHGESVVMRILDKEGLKLGLPELGFLSDDQALFEGVIALPDGIMLVTGPTGSGKTTTLYACLHYINKPDRKIITVEDPVEYQLSGINQVPVRSDIGMTFASALRAMLRQAPNIVMVGEIRDLETAEIAINASLTGHMVFSTLHTNDAPGAVTRLIDIGVKPFLVSTALRAVLAQRLVRKICPHCVRTCHPDVQQLHALNLNPAQITGATFKRGAGCAECNQTGYRGRMGIFELFLIDEELQRMIYDGASTSALREKARGKGMRTMREDGSRKVTSGMTTIEEVVSITIGDES